MWLSVILSSEVRRNSALMMMCYLIGLACTALVAS